MAQGESYIKYDVYQGADEKKRWGSEPEEIYTVSAADTANDGVAQEFTVKLPADEAIKTLPLGVYKDILTATVLYTVSGS